MKRLWKVGLTALGSVAVAGLAGTQPASADDTITAASWGGAYQMSQREAYYKPALKDIGLTVLEDEWTGTVPELRTQVETGDYKWDVVDADVGTAMAACDEGLLEPIDYDALGGKDRFLPGAANDCSVGTISYGTVYAYDANVYKDPESAPKTIADFFDVKKFPGKRAINNSWQHNIEIALMATGMSAQDASKYLMEHEDDALTKAFAELDKIKPYIVYWESGAQASQLLADGEVVMTTAWNGRIYDAVVKEGKNFVIVWDGQRIDYDVWAVPEGDPKKDLGMKFIEYASRPEVMARQSHYISYGPTTYAAVKLINPEVLKDLPTAPDHLTNAYWAEYEWMRDHVEEIEARFQAWKAS
jgi:putative spermidine/putrescine transport system substrate-binding protein